MNTKRCGTCGTVKPVSEFYRKVNAKDGYASLCKECQASYRASRKKRDCELDKTRRASTTGAAQTLLYHAKGGAKKREIPCTITREWIEERLERGTCEATGASFVIETGKGAVHPFAPSLMRIDSDLGYTPENTQLVIWHYTVAKQQYSVEQLHTLARLIVNHAQKQH